MRSGSYTRLKPPGKEVFVIAVIIMIMNALITFFYSPAEHLTGDLGLCLPSANHWNIEPTLSVIINNVAILGISVALIFYNKVYDIIKDTGQMFSSMFLILVSSLPWMLAGVNSSLIVLAVNLFGIWILSSTYRRDNATQEMFAIATMLSLGSMIQYAFLLFIPAYLLAAFVMKIFRVKEVLAFILGILAPYWTVIGLGLVSPADFRIPTLTNLFSGFAPPSDIFIVMLNIGSTMVLGILLMLNTIVRLYAGNSRSYSLYNLFNIIGFASAIFIIVDFNNLMAYISTFYLMMALQIAYLFSFRLMRHPIILYLVFVAIYLTSFYLIILI